MQNQRLKQHQALMQQALLQQQSLYHPGLLAAPRLSQFQVEICLLGLISACRSVYVGNIHTQVIEPLLQEVFASTGPVEICKLVRKEKSSYGFIHYFDRRCASLVIMTLNGRHLFGQPIKVNWAYASGQREDTTNHYNIFVGDLSPEVTDAMLYACFSVYPSCSDARLCGIKRLALGFVSFRNQQETQGAINDLRFTDILKKSWSRRILKHHLHRDQWRTKSTKNRACRFEILLHSLMVMSKFDIELYTFLLFEYLDTPRPR